MALRQQGQAHVALVKALVLLHGGKVEAHNEAPDQGSRFAVRLPRIE
ncbi:hypothetical protein [Janthinobacterium psychrotolerans]|nr:hypothetical protein [Janthinobacterium psychrotolerans]